MIRLKINNIEKVINLQEDIVFIVIENYKLFHDIINNLYTEQYSDIFNFYDEKYNSLDLDSKIYILYDYINYDLTNLKVFLDFTKKNKLTNNFKIKEKLNELYESCINLFEEIAIESPIMIEMNEEINFEYLIKALNIHFKSSNENIENIVKYCKIINEIYSKEIICFININSFFSNEEIEIIISELKMCGIKLLFISTNDNNIININNKKIVYIDNDLCEFYK